MKDRLREGPLDLPGLRLWINRMAADYEAILRTKSLPLTKKQQKDHLKALETAKSSCDGILNDSGKNIVRSLMAAGTVSYGLTPRELPEQLLPEQLILDFAVHALWPLVVVPKLPNTYLDDLTVISSESLARLVAHARLSRTTGSIMSPGAFCQALANTQFAAGVISLLNDLGDPRRGGAAFTALSIASTGTIPSHHLPAKTATIWVLAAAAAGVIGNRADDLLSAVGDWLTEQSHQAVTSHEHSFGGHSSSSSDMSGHHHSHNTSHGEGLDRIVENFIHGLFT